MVHGKDLTKTHDETLPLKFQSILQVASQREVGDCPPVQSTPDLKEKFEKDLDGKLAADSSGWLLVQYSSN